MPDTPNFHTMLFDEAQWAVLTDPYATDADIAAIVREQAAVLTRTCTRTGARAAKGVIELSSSKRNAKESGGGGGGRNIPPTLEEVIAHFTGKGSSQDEAEAFFNYWTTIDWWLVTDKKRMRNWHGAAATWMRNSKRFAAEREDNERRRESAREQARQTREQQRNRPDNYLPPSEQEKKSNARFF